MNAPTRFRRLPFRFERRGFPLASAVLAALAMGSLYFGSIAAPEAIAIFRLPSFFPVLLAGYREKSALPGLIFAALLGSAMILQAAGNSSVALAGSILTSIMLFAAVLVSSSVASVFTRRDALEDAARERQALLERAGSRYRIAAFLRAEALRDLDAHEGALLIPNPVQARWELILADGAWPTPEAEPGQPIPLTAWLVEKQEALVIDDLSVDPRFLDAGGTRSLLAHPLRRADQTLLAVLVLADGKPERFRPDDQQRLGPLLESAEAALRYAGAYAETDRSRDRLAAQLAVIQRAARELNTLLDAPAIAGRTVACALRVTRARGAAIEVVPPSGEMARQFAGAPLTDAGPTLECARGLETPEQHPVTAPDGAQGVRLLVPIRHGARSLGGLFVEVLRVSEIDDQDSQALTALAEHAATALANAHLFASVQSEREKSEQIVRTMSDGLLRLDADRQIASANPAAATLLGARERELKGDSICRALACETLSQCNAACPLQKLFGSGEAFDNHRWTLGDRRLLLAGAPLPREDDGELGSVILLRDVTLQEQSAEFQRELLATFAHEFRGPLANLTALAEVLADDAATGTATIPRDRFEMLRAQAVRLATLSERTLDAARLEAGSWPLEPRPLPLVSRARAALERWQRAAPARQFALRAPAAPLWAWADEEVVDLLLDNLLDNANKYAPAGSAVSICVENGKGNTAVVAVEDGGAAIPPAEFELLFEKFYRRERGHARSTYGYGLGLHIVRQLARAMGGDAWGESRDGAGNRFVFSLPVMEEEHEDPDRRR